MQILCNFFTNISSIHNNCIKGINKLFSVGKGMSISKNKMMFIM